LTGLVWLLWSNCDDQLPSQPSADIYRDTHYSAEQRAADLLARLSLEEKIGQMMQVDRGFIEKLSDIADYHFGSILSGGGSTPPENNPEAWAEMVDNFQLQAIGTRWGIPILYGIDAVHGHNNVYGAVIFPHNIGLGCTRNPDLVEAAARATAEEVAGTGIRWTFAPCLAVVRDERWGRTYEGFGETPELVAEMATAAVSGFQGGDLSRSSSILACAKHFLGDGGTVGGDDQGNNTADELTMRRIHLPGYLAAIDAGVGSIMASYSSWNGVRMHSSSYWLTTVLKEELGFEGFLVSDWAGINQLPGDYATQLATGINAGIDMVMLPERYKDFMRTMLSLVAEGRISEKRIDRAVTRILKVKFALGLFEAPFAPKTLLATVGSPAHRAIARECVRQSLVLLKNENRVLPINPTVRRIHVAGRNADDLGNQCGGWTISWQGASGDITLGTTILSAIRQRAGQNITVTFSEDGLGAKGADLALAVIGETPYAEGVGDRSDLQISQADLLTVINLRAAGVPTVAVLISGRPLILDELLLLCDGLIAAWLPGTEGDGVADVLFGDYSPVGKLSHSWPRTMAQIPLNYGDAQYDPLFPYGFGLTYE